MNTRRKSPYVLTRWIFIRFISLIYFVAFLSFLLQASGLYGSQGILPVKEFIETNFGELGGTGKSGLLSFLNYPSVFLYSCDDQTINNVPVLGLLFSALSVVGILPGFCLLLCWILYLSIVNAGQEFMSFQWDILLLEAGFLAIFFASWKPIDLFPFPGAKIAGLKLRELVPSIFIESGRPSTIMIWLYRWLAFRLLFASGLVKIGDKTWDSFTALRFHYETQPLPTPVGWIAHHLPLWFQMISTAGTFVVELAVPLMFFGPRSWRMVAALIQIAFQLLIIFTGNFCFFNWLTIAICLLLLDDGYFLIAFKSLKKMLPSGYNKTTTKDSFELPDEAGESADTQNGSESKTAWTGPMKLVVLVPLVSLVSFLSIHNFILLHPLGFYLPGPMTALVNKAYPFHLVNGYGLFARMTTERPEIQVEGSADGKNWLVYEFKYKPGPLNRPPPIIAPLQPRLDWQMWFASLGSLEHNPWFLKFSYRLLTGSKPVQALLLKNPFPDRPPRFVRARVYMYKMASIEDLLKTGNWWTREFAAEYMPPISLKEENRTDPGDKAD